MPETLSSSIVTLLKSKGEMTAVQIELELKEKQPAIANALAYMARSGKVFYRKSVVGRFFVKNVYFVVS